MDPAEAEALRAAFSAQEGVLGEHDTQLRHVKYLLEELLTRIPPPADPETVPVDTSPPPAAAAHARIASPDKYDGSPDQCEGFLLQCSLAFAHQSSAYPSDASRIKSSI